MSNRESLMLRYARNDMVKNKGGNLALVVVLVLSAFLMATGAMVIERLDGSVNELFAQAKPPHFLQMHKGHYDADALEAFAAEHSEIDAWTVVQLYGFDGAAIAWDRPPTDEAGDLDSLIDNLFVSQNPDFDFLIDESGRSPIPRRGRCTCRWRTSSGSAWRSATS